MCHCEPFAGAPLRYDWEQDFNLRIGVLAKLSGFEEAGMLKSSRVKNPGDGLR